MHHEILLRDAVAELHDLGPLPVHPNTLLAILAEDQRLAMLEHQLMIGLDLLVRHIVESAVIENIAVLQNLDERGPTMGMRALEHLALMLLLDVHRAGDEAGAGTERERDRIKRIIDRSGRR